MTKWFRTVLAVTIVAQLTWLGATFEDPRPEPIQRLTFVGQAGNCTAFHIGREYWVTAAHCLKPGLPMVVSGTIMKFVKADMEHDVAVLRGPSARGSYRMARFAPSVDERVRLEGWMGIKWIGGAMPMMQMASFEGHLTARDVDDIARPHWPIVDVYEMSNAIGVSGGPIVNSKGDLVGILVGGLTVNPHLAMSAPFTWLEGFLEEFK